MSKLSNLILVLSTLGVMATSCEKNGDDVIIVPPSSGSKITLNGGVGGAAAVNSVFVDLSADQQDSVKRASWDLGFSSGSDFKVILNYTTGGTAKVLAKTDLNQVTATDTIGLNLALGFDAASFKLLDSIVDPLARTVIAPVSATESENKVYIVNRGTQGSTKARSWYKIRVLRSGNSGYTLQYAKIQETSYKTLTINKDTKYNFSFASFDTGAVTVEPEKASWDFLWSGVEYKTANGPSDIPYYFSDFVYINNYAGVQAAEVSTSTVDYATFAEANITSVSFKSTKDVIGGNWRVTSGGTVGVKTDRFYVVKDASGNVYKLKFVSFHASDGGVRGYPVIEYALVKSGS